MQELADAFLRALAAASVSRADLAGWALAWARVLPAVLLVPAFGLAALAWPVRVALGLVMGLSVAPALSPVAAGAEGFWPLLLVEQALRGLPVALSAAAALWAATMAGGLIDDLRGSRDSVAVAVVEPGATPTGALLSMLAAIAFLNTGGPARVVAALARPEAGMTDALGRSVASVAAGVELAVAVAAPVVVAAIVFEVGAALVARGSGPAAVPSLLAPVRSVVLLGVAALLLDRMVHLLALASRAPL